MIFHDRRFVILVFLGVFISGTAIASRKFSQPSLGGEMSANGLLESAGRRERTRNQPSATSVSFAQTPADPVKSARREFTIYRNDEGEIICREATPDEIRARQDEDLNKVGLRQINHLGLDKSVSAQEPAATNLIIVLRATQQLQQNATAVAAFNRAAQNWEDVIMSPITIYIDVDFGATNFGDPWPANVLGATGAPSSGFPYQSVRTNLNAEATGEGNATKQAIFNALPANSVPTDLGNATAVDVYDSIARAIGLLPATAQPTDNAAQIAFNSQNTFDFDPSNGITAGTIDFDAVATHEIGHALGFDSDAGENIPKPTIWDLYRFHSGTTSATFPTAQRIMTTGSSSSDLQFDFIPGNPELGLSTGGPDGNGGDLWQSSHWKHVSTCTGYIGIMDPAISNGCRRTITSNDTLALSSFGYNLTNSNQPPPPPPSPTPPANDNFAAAQIISGCTGSVNGSTFGATRETGEPSHDPPDAMSLSPRHTIWYQWQAPSNGSTTITTSGSDFDTIVAVYTGTTIGSLTRIVFNDDVQDGVIRTSSVTFPATSGTVYRIAIDGWGGDMGTVKLNWLSCGATPTPTPSPTPSCVFGLSRFSDNFQTAGGTGSVNVNNLTGCSWQAVSNAGFITITSGSSGAGNGTVTYSVAANPGPQRFGTMTIAGATFEVSQAADCTVTLNPTSQSFPGTAGAGTVNISVQPGCSWQATSTQGFISVTSAPSGNGSATLSYFVAANTGAARSGTIDISRTILTINQAVGNPINDASFFVKQQYLDFLNRQADQSGLDFWTNQINSCGTDAQCIEVRRVNTSGAFFLSIEFQQTGNLVYKMYKAGFGNLSPTKPVAVDRAPFIADTRQIQSTPGQVIVNQGNWQVQLETNKQAFALAFVQRPAFQTAHASQTAANYVSSLFTNAGVSPTTAETNAATTAFGSGGDAGRAAALRSVAESASVAAKVNNEAFVLMQYFGYLQRNPYDPPESTLDYSGYNFWLGKLNQFNGDFNAAEMVKAFIASSEYR
ncbi:MAG TPA: NF038122 family metalloprotease [Pyrinomonadaceae bacterium]|jgi:hypothetical protein|nr:NF038122 family metalloprotease [Pyrinomonadaceae bacterium]